MLSHFLAMDGWHNQTTLHPIGIAVLVALGLATFAVPRRYALVPLLLLACFVPSAQRFVISTLDFNFLRVLVLLGWVRIMIRGEWSRFRWNRLDTMLVLWTVCATVTATMLHGTVIVLVRRLGIAYDAVGLYFMCRALVRDWSDVRAFAQCAAIVSIPVAGAFIYESTTGRNPFALLGGVPSEPATRGDRFRAQGPFSHAILAGAFWVALAPVIGALWWERGWSRALAVAGLVGTVIVVVTCASATPLGGLGAGVVAAALFFTRRWLPTIRWLGLFGLVVLQLLMSNPIWFLLARVNVVEGSTGWYRFKLIDDFVRHFSDWWLIGTTSRATWWYGGWFNITNEYVAQGINGGLITLSLYVATIVVAFIGVRRMLNAAERRRTFSVQRANNNRSVRRLRTHQRGARAAPLPMIWALGVMLFVQCVILLGVTYFGHVIIVWYIALGFIGSLMPQRAMRARRVRLIRRSAPTLLARRRRSAADWQVAGA
jgi:hypothetical protein